jgi:hypothetical protein
MGGYITFYTIQMPNDFFCYTCSYLQDDYYLATWENNLYLFILEKWLKQAVRIAQPDDHFQWLVSSKG